MVHLVGAGPGDPGLMTRRSLELIAAADVILYDRLIPPGALDGARPDAELRYVGKEPGAPAMEQDDINALLVELGRAGRRVVRLKGGDPFVFGRGGEEAEALAAAGVDFEVVPGVTAGVAAPAYAGIPVTHRDAGVGGGLRDGATRIPDPDGSAALDWDALARFPGTLVFYMGVRNLPLISERLRAAGRDPKEPAAVVARGTLSGQRTVTAPLDEIAERVAEAGLAAAGGHRHRPRRRASRHARLARAAPASRPGRRRSPAPAPSPAASPPGCAASAPRCSRRRRSASSRAPFSSPAPSNTT